MKAQEFPSQLTIMNAQQASDSYTIWACSQMSGWHLKEYLPFWELFYREIWPWWVRVIVWCMFKSCEIRHYWGWPPSPLVRSIQVFLKTEHCMQRVDTQFIKILLYSTQTTKLQKGTIFIEKFVLVALYTTYFCYGMLLLYVFLKFHKIGTKNENKSKLYGW